MATMSEPRNAAATAHVSDVTFCQTDYTVQSSLSQMDYTNDKHFVKDNILIFHGNFVLKKVERNKITVNLRSLLQQ